MRMSMYKTITFATLTLLLNGFGVCGTAACAGTSGDALILDRGRVIVQTDSRRRCICPAASDRNLLGLKRDTPFAPGRLAAGAAEVTTLRVLAIRVDFPTEEPDDSLTTGNGRFDLRDTLTFFEEEGHNLDGAPHDRRYFHAHLRALGRYWNVVSNGRLRFDPDTSVFPVARDSAYTLPNLMSYYGTQVIDDSVVIVDRLRQLVIDAVTTASENDPAVTFSDYDALMIFHAGADGQSDVLGDTPRDIFSGFLKLPEPLYLRGGTDSVVEAIVMPETQAQDGRLTLLNAVLAHEFGHQLGLVDLYNTDFTSPFAFATEVGNFSLMDNNGSNLGVEAQVGERVRIILGALPVFPDAWSRAFLGFAGVATVRRPQPVTVWVGEGEEDPPARQQIWRVPVSETEYYLLENRQFDIDGDGEGALRQDSVTGVILGPAVPNQLPGQPPVFTREYDFLLPGRGLLIWHVDETVAADDFITDDDIPNNFLANTLQWDRDHRFLRVVEADGLQQLGGTGIFSIYTGSAGDYWPHGGQREFSSTSNPPARSYSGAVTGIRLWDIQDPGQWVTLNAAVSGPLPGFPVYAGSEREDAAALVVSDLVRIAGDWLPPGDGSPELFAGYKDYVLAWNWDGSPLGGPTITDTVTGFDTAATTRILHPVAQGNTTGDHWIGTPLIYNPSGGGTAGVVAVSQSGSVSAWYMRDRDGDSLFDLNFTARTSGRPSAPPVIWWRPGTTIPHDLFIPVLAGGYDIIDMETGLKTTHLTDGTILGVAGRSAAEAVVVRRRGNAWFVGALDPSDGPEREITADSLFGPLLCDLDRTPDGHCETIVLDAGGYLWVLDSLMMPVDGFNPLALDFLPAAPATVSDIDRDGYLDILVVGGGHLYAWARNGTLLPNFPVLMGPRNAPAAQLRSPVTGDPGDGVLALFTAGSAQRIEGVAGNGVPIDGMPRSLGGAAAAPGAWALNSDQSQGAVFMRSADGYIYAYEVPVRGTQFSQAIWPMGGHDAYNTRTLPNEDLDSIRTPGEFFAAGRAFVYPNPAGEEAIVRYWLGADADVTIGIYDLTGNRVTGWTGVGTGNAYNEWTWFCADAASGVYVARLELSPRGGGATETVFCKLSVIQ